MTHHANTPRARSLLFVLPLVAAGCWGNEVTEFPTGLEPLDGANRATRPALLADGSLPETMTFTRGETNDWEWVHGRGFVKAPLAETWKAFQDPLVVIDRRQVDEWTVDEDVEAGFDRSFVVHNRVFDFITVEFDMTWRQSVVEGDAESPEVVAMRFQKTFGTVFIDILRGSVVLRAAPEDEGVTEVEFVEHIDAAQGGADRINKYLVDLHGSVVERAHGRELPVYPD